MQLPFFIFSVLPRLFSIVLLAALSSPVVSGWLPKLSKDIQLMSLILPKHEHTVTDGAEIWICISQSKYNLGFEKTCTLYCAYVINDEIPLALMPY